MIEPVARIYIELQDIQPRIWRRVDVPLTSHLLTLHNIIQIAFGWTDSHLFQFSIGNRDYGVPSEEDEFWGLKFYRAAGLRLRSLVARGVERFLYVYDFGDDWRHDIVIERIGEGEPHIDYPVFVDGKRRTYVTDFFEADSRSPNAPVAFSTVANAGFPSALSAR